MLLRREDVQRNWNPHNDSLLLNYLPWPMPMNFPIILCGGTKTCMEFIWCTTYSIFVQFGIFNYRSTWKFLFDTSSWPIKNIVKDIAIPCKKVNRKSGDVRFLKGGVAVDRSNISASKKICWIISEILWHEPGFYSRVLLQCQIWIVNYYIRS